ncbi:bifunctional serine/threonine-protein kinase/ABC transporter substrate-binding protein [Streptomyces sp. NPDC002623]
MEPLRSSDPARIADHRLLGRLGAGGMGVVYLARTPGGALVALKVLLAEYAEDQDFKERFRREVEVARLVDTPWAVPLVDADADAEAPWLATAFVPGPSLGEAVSAHGPLAEHGLRLLGARLAEALSEVHRAGLVHRDLKPGNVLLAHDGPRLIDFGIARAPEDTALTATGMVVGTPGYLSPEQAGGPGGDDIGPASDVFALGCVLAFAATGRAPFGSGAVDALLYRAVHDPADLDGVPPNLLQLVERCLEKDPAGRPTAEELARELAEEPEEQSESGKSGATSGWLPEPVSRLIAERSAAALALPDIEHTHVTAGAPAQPDDDTAPAESEAQDTPPGQASAQTAAPEAEPEPEDAAPPAARRRFLLLAGGAVALAASGGAAWWAVARDDDSGDDAPAASASSQRPVHTIALHGDLSGPQREAGKAQERGLRLAVAEFNARTDAPFTVRVKAVDDAGDPATAERLATELTDDPAVLAVVGPTTDATAQTALAKYDAGLLPVVGVSPGGVNLALYGFRSFFQARLTDSAFPIYVHNYLTGTARSRKVGIVLDRPAGNYASELGSSLSVALTGAGQPSVPEVVSAMRPDFGSAVDGLLAAGVDSVFFAGLYDRGALIAGTLRDRKFQGARVSGPALLDGRFLTEAQDAAEGWVVVAPVIDATVKPEAKAFAAAYRERWKEAPPWYAAEAYDVTGMLLKSLSGLPTKGRTREKLLAALRAVKYEGITKQYAFQQNGQLVIDGNGGYLWRVEQGDFVYGGPAPLTR